MPVYHTTYLQICDLAKADAAVSQLLQQAPVPPTPSEAYGWFTYSSNQQLQQALQIAFGKVLKQQQEQLEKQQQEQPQQETTEAGRRMSLAYIKGHHIQSGTPTAIRLWALHVTTSPSVLESSQEIVKGVRIPTWPKCLNFLRRAICTHAIKVSVWQGFNN